MIRISVAIITFNEGKNIGRCIESVKGVADEVLVVDSHSTDDTISICSEMGATVIERDFEGHIEQKNFALESCKYDYVLSLDGDEALSSELRESILQVKNNWDSDGYCFNRLTNYVGKWIHHCGWYPDRKLRLVDRRLASWGGTNPHDILKLSGDAKARFLPGDIHHYSYESISDHISQTNYFTDISAKHSFAEGARSNLFKVITRPVLKFVRDYFWKRGFLDGGYGFIICYINALSAMLKYAKIRELQKDLEK